ncbi:MAG: hypothetical protein J7L95_01915 [Prolixibacteraceae bacterium]|nr:hypothetical protein [Prolixibacteraceae bacterium]
MKFKIKISKKLIVRLALFVAVIGAANLLDIYFENHPLDIKQAQSKQGHSTNENGTIYFFTQVNLPNAKTPIQKIPTRKLFEKSHNKFLREYHQIRNYQVLKAENKKSKTPLIPAFHYLVFQNYFFTIPDDEPLLS